MGINTYLTFIEVLQLAKDSARHWVTEVKDGFLAPKFLIVPRKSNQ